MHAMRLFADVAGCRSFSLAASRHGITQSAASQRISQLEKRLGVTLLDRSVRPLTLTEAGQVYLRGCRQVLEQIEQVERQVAKLRPRMAGQVVVDAIYSAGIDLLNHVKELFEAQVPEVGVTVDYKRPDEVYDAVRNHRCDLGILSYPQRWRDVGIVPLRHEKMGVVCAPTHVLAARQSVHAGELGGYDMVTFEPGLPAGRHIRRYLKEHGSSPPVVNVFDNIDTVKSAVAVTQAFAILPRRTVMREVHAGTLVAVDLTPELLRPIGIIYPKPRRGNGACGGGGALTPPAQAFVDFLLKHAGPEVDLPVELTAVRS